MAESPLPASDSYVAAMPDVHLGKGVTIGTVFASEEFVCPNAVGVDIGGAWTASPWHALRTLRQCRSLPALSSLCGLQPCSTSFS